MQKYTLEELIKTFDQHAIKNDAQLIKDRKDHPDAEWTKNDFNISRALHMICMEIYLLKNRENED